MGNEFFICHYVIERAHLSHYVGDITFTQFKKGEKHQLTEHIINELKKVDINQYKDTTRFYRFANPYLLRAQNSRNRSGYGWEWDWSGGLGSYIRGTEYGETTNYVFAGVYISSSYFYEPKRRHEFVSPTEERTLESGNTYQIETRGFTTGTYELIPYVGKLFEQTKETVQTLYIAQKRDGKEKSIPVSLSEKERKIYIHQTTFDVYKEPLLNENTIELKKNFFHNLSS